MTCHICHHPTELFLDEKSGIIYYRCDGCGVIFKDPQGYQDLDQQKQRYDLHDNSEDHSGYQAYFQRFLDVVLPCVGAPELALDFGCGRSTLLASMLETKGISCRYYDPIYFPDVSYQETRYDLIVSTEVFEHLHHPREVFELLVGALNAGGYLAIQTQFYPQDTEVFKKWYYHQDATHIVFFTLKTFEWLAKRFNCTLIADNQKNIVVIQKNLKE